MKKITKICAAVGMLAAVAGVAIASQNSADRVIRRANGDSLFSYDFANSSSSTVKNDWTINWGSSANSNNFFIGSGGTKEIDFNGPTTGYATLEKKIEGFTPGTEYTIAFTAYANNDTEFEFNVKFASSQMTLFTSEYLVQEMISATELTTFKFKFVPTIESGQFRFGLGNVSSSIEIYMASISITEGWEEQVQVPKPAAVTNPSVTAGTKEDPEALKLNYTCTAPTTDVDGNALTDPISINIYEWSELLTTIENVTPGQTVTWTREIASSGSYAWNSGFVAVNGNKKSAKVEVAGPLFVGHRAPAAPQNVQVVATDVPGQVKVTWDAVTTNTNDEALAENLTVTYNVKKLVGDDYNGTLVEENVTGTELTFNAFETEGQGIVKVSVQANDSKATSSYAQSQNGVLVGFPYDGISGPLGDYAWETESGENGNVSTWGGKVTFYNYAVDNEDSLLSGFVSLASYTSPFLKFHIQGNGEAQLKVSVLDLDAADSDWTEVLPYTALSEFAQTDGVYAVLVGLSDYVNKNIRFKVTYKSASSYEEVYLSDIETLNVVEYKLTAAIDAPEQATTLKEYTVTVNVANEGSKAIEAYTVKLYRQNGEEAVETAECGPIASGATQHIAFNFTMPMFPAEDELSYYAVVEWADDANHTTDVTTVGQLHSDKAAPTNLAGDHEATEKKITLTWTAPVVAAGGMKTVWENDYYFTGFTNDWSTDSGSLKGGWRDTWAITSGIQLEGGKTYTLEFETKGGSDAIGIYYGTSTRTSNLVDHPFTTRLNVTEIEYTKKSYTFTPETSDTYYIGFKMLSESNWIWVRNIKVLEPVAVPQVTGYQVYHAQELLANNVAETTYTHSDVEAGTHIYHVAAVYDDGEVSAPVAYTVAAIADGVEEIKAALGGVEAIFTLDGVKVEGTLAPGLYIVVKDGKSSKLIVR